MDQANRPIEGHERPAKYGALSRSQRRLVELMREIGFGRIEGLPVRAGEPVLDSSLRVLREVHFGKGRLSMARAGSDDRILRREVLELLAQLDGIGDGTVTRLEIRHGLPFRAHVEERIGAMDE